MKSKRTPSILMIILGLLVLSKFIFDVDFSYSRRDIANIVICICTIFYIALGFISLNNVIKKEKTS